MNSPGGPIGVVDVDAAQLPAGLRTVDLLARLQVEARRRGLGMRLRDPAPALVELIALLGLADVLPVAPAPVTRPPAAPTSG